MKNIVVGLVLVCVLLSMPGCIHIATPEEGEHIGYITEVAYRGLIWPTHYIKLVDSHFSVGSEGYQSYWYYGFWEQNPSSMAIYEQAKSLKDSNKLVVIKYKCDFITTYWESSEGCKVTGIQVKE